MVVVRMCSVKFVISMTPVNAGFQMSYMYTDMSN
jgi:hypothetical protein